jgi:FtsP/CotA-like multicopper oxidase with cupredoxin domain
MNIFATKIRKAIFIFLLAILPSLSWGAQREFSLTIDEVSIDVAPGFSNKVFAFNGQVPGPLIHVMEGDDVTVHVTNNTTLPHSIHWHGINQTGSWKNDGVPGVTQEAIQPGESYIYKFKTDRPGTLWYHCHVNVWEHVGNRPTPIFMEKAATLRTFPTIFRSMESHSR